VIIITCEVIVDKDTAADVTFIKAQEPRQLLNPKNAYVMPKKSLKTFEADTHISPSLPTKVPQT